MIQASIVWMLVLLSGTPNTGYQVRLLYASETRTQCEAERANWLAAFSDQVGFDRRLQCVKHDQKNLVKEDR